MQPDDINILLVEDDAVDVMNVQRAFLKSKIPNPLYIANNGMQALAMLRGEVRPEEQLPDHRRLVLLDLNMPRMNGLEFLQALRADRRLRATPVVVLTTSDQERDRVEAYNLNVAGYMLKPVTFGQFSEMMQTLSHYWSLCVLP